MISLLSCRQIGNNSYILSNINYTCNSDQYNFYSMSLVFPFLISWVIVIPFILLVHIYRNRSKLDSLFTNMKFGFLYREYKSNVYYWEFIKIAQKLSIILALNFYYQNVVIKGLLVILIITAYGIISNKLKPYKEDEQNYIDSLSTKVCALTIYLCLLMYQNDYKYLVIISVLMIFIINISFVCFILTRVFHGYKQKIQKIFEFLTIKVFKKQKQQQISKKQINPKLREKIRRSLINYCYLSLDKRQEIMFSVLNNQISQQFSAIKAQQNIQKLEQSQKQEFKFETQSPYIIPNQNSHSTLSIFKLNETQNQSDIISQYQKDQLIGLKIKSSNKRQSFIKKQKNKNLFDTNLSQAQSESYPDDINAIQMMDQSNPNFLPQFMQIQQTNSLK
ncbi:transmembrane protein, putative (macronuclear) [Tetrahymena thermophila SB210]|uniref:Transmembrane protein, putative n=1 Tax=Tetrahymena thermophila (strain SB210) TaxID=312017 RepID=Q22UK2_TETTS|nr:transmembrane protein, putative [Tetrahymena thermophila SB210]EAR88968.2 transmembrane protein, putative [Tetrahymena thermophila SB210]|eukprot:XP_001009213.2 transmembrane protein, putative [Tetrahymena thermophila SB210]